MLKVIYASAASAIVAAAFVATLGMSPPVEARGADPGAKADRADIRPLGRQCSERGWPYFEAGCLRDARNPYGEVRAVRIVSADRPL